MITGATKQNLLKNYFEKLLLILILYFKNLFVMSCSGRFGSDHKKMDSWMDLSAARADLVVCRV